MPDPIIKKNSAKFDTAHNIETSADIANKTAEVKNLVTGETYQGSGGGSGLPDISDGDAGKVLAVSDELAAEWVSNPVNILTDTEGTLNASYNDLKSMLQNNTIPYTLDVFVDDGEVYTRLLRLQLLYETDDSYLAMFANVESGGWYPKGYASTSADDNLVLD